jgi:nitrite reductase/ring-hydroxylating ferredoxin subunit
MVDIIVGRDVSSIVKTVVVLENTGQIFGSVEHCPVAGGPVLYFEMHTRNTCHNCCLVRDTGMCSSLRYLQETSRKRY